jgi:VTC domain
VTAAGRAAVLEAASRLRPMSLDAVTSAAGLQTRVDRKYLVPASVFELLVDSLADRMMVLEIGGSRLFRYESVYFDTPELMAYRQHAHGRRRRAKVRTRTYLDSGDCLLETKAVGAHGETIKTRYPHRVEARHQLDARARELVARQLGTLLVTDDLAAVVTTAYRRATLVDPTGGSRITCDVDLEFRGPGGSRPGPCDMVLIESKALGAATQADRALYRLGQRPVSLSKYCVGMAMLDPSLPANKWNRELRVHFGWEPSRLEGLAAS